MRKSMDKLVTACAQMFITRGVRHSVVFTVSRPVLKVDSYTQLVRQLSSSLYASVELLFNPLIIILSTSSTGLITKTTTLNKITTLKGSL